MGFWEFNPVKCTQRDDMAIPLEEFLWLFHHVLKTALYQLKAFELVPAQTAAGEPSAALKGGVSAALAASTAFGVWALAFAADDHVRCLGLVAAFFAPVWLLVWQFGAQFVPRHADRIAWGWCAAQFGAQFFGAQFGALAPDAFPPALAASRPGSRRRSSTAWASSRASGASRSSSSAGSATAT